MAKISHQERERILLGYSPRNSVDFSDVFGGPPRRSSAHEFYINEGISSGSCSRTSINYADNNHNNGDDNDVDVDVFDVKNEGIGSSWEKPVFGDDKMGVRIRSRYPSQDFFDDIFRGDQQPLSCSQSPRLRPAVDPFSSAPSSRIGSPTRPSPNTTQPFSIPSKFSLPAKLANTDFTVSTSPHQRSNSPKSSLSKLIQNHDAFHSDARISYRPSPLSNQPSSNDKDSSTRDGSSDGSSFVKDSTGSEASNDSTQFHFSIYKWASKGVPLVMSLRKRSPSRSKERITKERSLSGNERVQKSAMPSTSGVKDCDDCNGTVGCSENVENPIISKSTSYAKMANVEEPVDEDAISYGLEDLREAPTSPAIFSMSSVDSLQEEETGNKPVTEKGGKGHKIKEKEKPFLVDDDTSYKVNKSKVHEQTKEAKDEQPKSRVRGKVKEFVKIFNQESSTKAASGGSGQSQSCRWKDTTTLEPQSEVKCTSTRKYDEMQASYVNSGKTWLDPSEVVDAYSILSEKQQFDINSVGSVSDPVSPAPANESAADGSRSSTPSSKASSENDSLSKKSPQVANSQSEVEHQEETQNCERKVAQWSKGKEGNIRALLSTLQNVLWANSGWKPVPLVDIIEANAVKRAYQKALLCLHPDKLQQKGAASFQKLIAEKIFDILQESWDQFNSLGSL